jgi:hypothetical protein
MKKNFLMVVVAVAALLGLTSVVAAQEPRSTGATASTFVMSEFAEKPVTGAPYSALSVTETRQKLADGNEIVNKSEATIYRDTQGRTRREQNLKTIGGLTGAPPVQVITISDPVAGVSYTLDPGTKTARKSGFNSFVMAGGGAMAGPVSVNTTGGTGAVTFTRSEGGGGVGYTLNASPSGPVTTTGDRVSVLKQSLEQQARDNVKREDLGTQTIEGVEATGTRNTMTIPAGQIGNERPIEVVSERWYSKELQTTVMSRRSDPRSGETIFRLTNINRSEPVGSLFEVPGDYKVSEVSGTFMRTRQ